MALNTSMTRVKKEGAMTEQEKIKGRIANRLWWLDNADEFDTEEEAITSKFYTDVMKDIYHRKAQSVMELEDSLGVVVKVERELPYSHYANVMFESKKKGEIKEALELNSIYEKGQEDMLKAGCGFFEPLIKEVSND